MDAIILVLTGAVIVLAIMFAKRQFMSFLAQKPEDYSDATDVFDIRTHLNGPMICEGLVYGPTGRVSSRFVGYFNAEWNRDEGVITEHFLYNDGTTQDRTWRLKVLPDRGIDARADDVIGGGYQSGPSVQLKYRIRLPKSSGGYVLDAVDWMYLTPSGAIVNRSQFRKFGIKVAELFATIRPVAVVEKYSAAA
ncbi:MAG: DUF3833 family protein [Rhodobacteraceae bacterium]|nr:DUF3833 family protein [Paracoccaceae bacterium]